MTVGEIQQIMESWAPPQIAWERDPPGLQCGSASSSVRGILVSLDATERTVAEARRRRANLIVTHHPLLFRPLTALDTMSSTGRVLGAMIKQEIALLSAHTSLDFTWGGTSFALAAALGLTGVEFLHLPYRLQTKVVTFVPSDRVDRVATAMAQAGAGIIGKYAQCSFRVHGTGTFEGGPGTQPAVGHSGRLEQVSEVRLEMVAPKPQLDTIIRAMKAVHPYEEVAFDIYPLENVSTAYGLGAIGRLRRPQSLGSFLTTVRNALGTRHLRYTGDRATRVTTVAVCGGGGADLAVHALRHGADVFVTADVKYHVFQECAGRLAVVDAGHFETEYPVVAAMAAKLRAHTHRIPIHAAAVSTNPVEYA